MAALEWLAAGAAAGDSLVFSFSGHGAPGFARGHALLPCDFSKVREAAGRSRQAVLSCDSHGGPLAAAVRDRASALRRTSQSIPEACLFLGHGHFLTVTASLHRAPQRLSCSCAVLKLAPCSNKRSSYMSDGGMWAAPGRRHQRGGAAGGAAAAAAARRAPALRPGRLPGRPRARAACAHTRAPGQLVRVGGARHTRSC